MHNPVEWKPPDNIDKHPLRYWPMRDEIEKILSWRALNKRLDGYLLETSYEIAEVFKEAFDELQSTIIYRGK